MLTIDSCNFITIPIMIFMLKDNVDLSMISDNYVINMAILLVSLALSKQNFQASVYIMFAFLVLQLSSKKKTEIEENFTPNESIAERGASYPDSYTYKMTGDASEVIPESTNAYVYNPLLNAEYQEPSEEPVQSEVLGYNDDFMNYESF